MIFVELLRLATFLAALLAGLPAARAAHPEPTLTIRKGEEEHRLTRAELLRSPALKELSVPKDPSYPGREMHYAAVPVASLFEGMPVAKDDTLLFSCTDGFSAPISSERVLNKDAAKAVAYVAMEKPGEPWPPLKPEKGPKNAGPFYLVWEHPERSRVVTEEWPFQLAGFEVKPSLEKQFPLTAPDAKLSANHPARRGYRVFASNCFACHRMNGQGTSEMGPDLNLPHNPTEYLRPAFLKKQIRNPQSVKAWAQSRMTSFDVATLPEAELNDLIAYLRHMAGRKAQASAH